MSRIELGAQLESEFIAAKEELRDAAHKFVVTNIERLFVQANVVNGRSPKEFTGYDSELEEKAALVALFPLLKSGLEIDAVMGIPRMGESFGQACWKVLDKTTGKQPHWVISRKVSVDEAIKFKEKGLGEMIVVDSYTNEKKQAIFVPYAVSSEGEWLTHERAEEMGVKPNFWQGMKVVLGDDFIALGNAGEGVVEGMSRLGTEVVALCAYVSKHMQGGFDSLRRMHETNPHITKPLVVSVAIAIEGIEPYDEPVNTGNGASKGKVVLKPTVSDVANTDLVGLN